MPLQILAVFAFFLHATLNIPVGDPARPRLLVTISVEGPMASDRQLLNDAALTARELWRPYVDVAFGYAGDIRRTIEVDQLSLVITDRLLAPGEPNGLGWIEFTNDEPSQTITVSTTALGRLMEISSWSGRRISEWPQSVRRRFLARALGRSVAHEMGHYLLRSKLHTRKGLMRDHVTADEIMNPNLVKDSLEAEELKRLNGRLFEYAAAMSGERPPA